MAKKINKNAQEEFLALELKEQMRLLNEVLEVHGTKGISEAFDFSYSWIQGKLKEKNVYYVQSINRFVKEEEAKFLTDIDIVEIKTIIKDYQEFKISINKEININNCIGACGTETTTRSIVLDKKVSAELKKFAKKNSFMSMKDIYTSAIKEFIDKYNY